jgi:Spy/CpxP family protein refolding chaperone
MISFRTLSLPMFAFAASLVACSAEQNTTAQPDTASTAQQASQAEPPADHGPGARGFHHGPPGGPEFLIGAALHAPDLALTDAQRTTIEGLAHGDRPDHRERPPFDATKAKELAAAIRSGNVASLPAPPAFDSSKMQAHLAESAARVKTLHDTLSADQRAKLVAHVEAHAPKGPPAGGHMRGPHGDMLPFGHDLNLTDAQKQQLQAKFEANHPKPDFAAIHAEMQTKLESFKADSFDATAFVTPSAQLPPKLNGNPLADLVSVLTPEQREILAKKIEAGPPARP